MEVLRKKSNSGKVFRIMDDLPNYGHYYVIEYLKDDAWWPAFEPVNHCFKKQSEAEMILETLLID